jgi:hypothetical protein
MKKLVVLFAVVAFALLSTFPVYAVDPAAPGTAKFAAPKDEPLPSPWPPRGSVPAPWPPRSDDKKMKAEGDTPAPAPVPTPSLLADFKLQPNNLSGDFGLMFAPGAKGTFAAGIGLDLISYKQGLLTARAQAFFPTGDDSAVAVGGVSVMCNLLQLVNYIPSSSWVAKTINPSIGFFGGYDFVNGRPTIGPMISIINVPF